MSDQLDWGEIPDLSEIGGHWDPRKIEWHGGEKVMGDRKVAVIPGRAWPFKPEYCMADSTDTTWILNGRVLLCNGCGIDGT